MLTEQELKEKLKGFAENRFQSPGEGAILELIPEMLNHIGSLDSELRDDLIYSALATWILEHNAIQKDEMRKMVHKVISDEYMFKGIGEQESDTVFQRSFSV